MKKLSKGDGVGQSKAASIERTIGRRAKKAGTTSVLRRTDQGEARRRPAFRKLDLRDQTRWLARLGA
jgi:hypothetical protein